jgi:hypothetical protein
MIVYLFLRWTLTRIVFFKQKNTERVTHGGLPDYQEQKFCGVEGCGKGNSGQYSGNRQCMDKHLQTNKHKVSVMIVYFFVRRILTSLFF